MRMKKWLAAFTALLIPAFSTAAAEGGVTLRTVSCFAGTDSAAEAYVEILNRYESESGNTVADSSSTSDEAWKTAILKDFAAGTEPDILFFFAAGADSVPILPRVVSLAEINAEFASAKKVTPFKVTVRPTRASGWVNLRWAPSKSASLIATYPANSQLLVIKETTNWFQVEDQDTGDVGFISKQFVSE